MHERLEPFEIDLRVDHVTSVDRGEVLHPGAVHEQDLARLWVDFGAEEVRLYLTDGPWKRVLERRFSRSENPEVSAEEVGHVAYAAVGALRAGRTIGVAREELVPKPPAPPPPAQPELPPPPPPMPSPWRARAGLFWEGGAYANGPQLQSGPGVVVLGTHERDGRLFGVQLSAQFRLSSRVGDLVFDGGALRAQAVAGVRRKSMELSATLGPGLDLARAELDVLGLQTNGRISNVVPTLRAGAQIAWHTRWVRPFLAVGFDVLLARPRYLLEGPGGSSVLLSPWTLQPFVAFGATTP